MNAIYLLDTSGSIDDDSYSRAYRYVERTHKKYDKCALIAFDYFPHMVIPLGGDILKWPNTNDLPGHGGTYLGPALVLAKSTDPMAKIHVLSDGYFGQEDYFALSLHKGVLYAIYESVYIKELVEKFGVAPEKDDDGSGCGSY